MATITFNIPDAQLARVVGALSDYYGWSASLGITHDAFVKQKLVAHFVETLKNAEINQALATARTAAETGFIDPNIT